MHWYNYDCFARSAVSIMEREEAAAAAAEASGLDASHTLYTMGTSARAEPEDSSASYLKQQLKFSGQRPSPAPYPHGRAEERARSSAAGGVEEQLPGTLFSRPLGDSQQQLVAQPIKLKTAMKSVPCIPILLGAFLYFPQLVFYILLQ